MLSDRNGPSFLRLLAVAVPVIVAMALLPRFVGIYQVELLTYGLAFAIAALGFNLLLGYTGLLSFGHSAYFGAGAYTVAFIARDLRHPLHGAVASSARWSARCWSRPCSATCACATPASSSAS